MILTPKRSWANSLTVRLTPSSATDPFGAIKGASSVSASTTKRTDSASGRRSTIRASPSTWPKTRCPPSSSPSRKDLSRLTGVPTSHCASVVWANVSTDAWIENAPGSTATTVRHAPEQAIEAPRGMAEVSKGVAIVRSRRSPRRRRRTLPRSVMMPVNMWGRLRVYPGIFQGLIVPEGYQPRRRGRPCRDLLFADPEDRQHVRTDRFHRHALKSRRVGQLGEAEAANRRNAVAANQQRSMDPGEAVDEPGTEEGRGEFGAPFDEEPRDAAVTEHCESCGEVDLPLGVGTNVDQGHAAVEECGAPDRISRTQSQDPGWHATRLGNEARRLRNPQVAVDYNPHRRSPAQSGQTAGP